MELDIDTSVGQLKLLMDMPKYAPICDRMRAVVERRRGRSFPVIARTLDRSLAFVKEWNDRYKAQGGLGLLDRPKGLPATSLLNPELEQKFKDCILKGPTPEDGRARFRMSDIRNILRQEFSVEVGRDKLRERLKQMGLVLLKPRPVHEKNDAIEMENWKENFPLFLNKSKRDIRTN